MPWRASSVMEEKLRFILEYERDEVTMSAAVRRYGDLAGDAGMCGCGDTGRTGLEGLLELNRAPARHPNQTPTEIERTVLELRQAHMRWGPRKLKRVLERDEPGRAWPATSTIGELVKRAGLVVARKKRRKTEPYSAAAGRTPMDRTGCGAPTSRAGSARRTATRIDPLTITDAYSRYLLRCQAVEKTDTRAGAGDLRSGLSRVRNAGGDPHRQRGAVRVDRRRRVVAAGGVVDQAGHRAGADRGRAPGAERAARAHASDAEAGGGHAPGRGLGARSSECWIASARSTTKCGRTKHWTCRHRPRCTSRRRVSIRRACPSRSIRTPCWCAAFSKTGCFTWKKYNVFLSEVLWGERIGLLPMEDDWFTVYFAQVPVARFTSRHHRVLPLLKPKADRPSKQAARTGSGEASPDPVHKPSNQDEVSGMCPV